MLALIGLASCLGSSAPGTSNECTPAVKLSDTDPEPRVKDLSAVNEEEVDGSVVVEAVVSEVLLAVVELQIAAQSHACWKQVLFHAQRPCNAKLQEVAGRRYGTSQ